MCVHCDTCAPPHHLVCLNYKVHFDSRDPNFRQKALVTSVFINEEYTTSESYPCGLEV